MTDSRSEVSGRNLTFRLIAFAAASARSFPESPTRPGIQQKTMLKNKFCTWSTLVKTQSTKERSVFKATFGICEHNKMSFQYIPKLKVKHVLQLWKFFWNADSIMLLSNPTIFHLWTTRKWKGNRLLMSKYRCLHLWHQIGQAHKMPLTCKWVAEMHK